MMNLKSDGCSYVFLLLLSAVSEVQVMASVKPHVTVDVLCSFILYTSSGFRAALNTEYLQLFLF